jgi:hypothetical protein
MFAKLFDRITESSLMEEEIPTRYAFVMLLAIADRHGEVIGTDVALSRRLNMPLEDFREAIKKLSSPDKDSNSTEFEGRRLIPSEAERGYHIVNYVKYRDIKNEDERREYMRAYMAKKRGCKQSVNTCKQKLAVLAHTDLDVDVEADANVKTIVQKPKAVFEPVDSDAKEGLFFEPGVQIPQDEEKDAGKGQETQMQGKPAKPRKAKKAKTDAEPKINAWGIWIDVCREQRLAEPAKEGPDLAAAKNIAKSIGDADKVEHVMRMYLQDRDPWLLGHGHGLRYIGARINRYLNDSGGVGIPGEVWADDAEAEAIIEGKIETPF